MWKRINSFIVIITFSVTLEKLNRNPQAAHLISLSSVIIYIVYTLSIHYTQMISTNFKEYATGKLQWNFDIMKGQGIDEVCFL